jgi:hypothetical protein
MYANSLVGALIDSDGAMKERFGTADLANGAEEAISALLSLSGCGSRGSGGCHSGQGGCWLKRRTCGAVEASSVFFAIEEDGAANLIGLAKDGVTALDALLALLKRLGLSRADGTASEFFHSGHNNRAALALVAGACLVAALVARADDGAKGHHSDGDMQYLDIILKDWLTFMIEREVCLEMGLRRQAYICVVDVAKYQFTVAQLHYL